MSVDFENVLKAPRQPRVRVRYTPEEEDDDCGSIIAQGFLWFIFLIYLISSIVSFYFFFKYTSDTSVDCKDAFPVLVFIEAMLLLVTGAAPVYFLVKFQLQEEMQAFDWRMFRGVHKRLIAGWVVVILITAAVVLIYGDSLDAVRTIVCMWVDVGMDR